MKVYTEQDYYDQDGNITTPEQDVVFELGIAVALFMVGFPLMIALITF